MQLKNLFSLEGKNAVITGGAGLLGQKHAEAIAEMGGNPILLDINEEKSNYIAKNISKKFGINSKGYKTDITNPKAIRITRDKILNKYGKINILINNAANNPKVEKVDNKPNNEWTMLENFPLDSWNQDIAVGLTGAFLCSQILGQTMAENNEGVILNIASDLGVIAPDQRIYKDSNQPQDSQPKKPITYSVVKSGLIGLTKYLATYYAPDFRVNTVILGGIHDDRFHPDFVDNYSKNIPMGRMMDVDEMTSVFDFLLSEKSSYVTGNEFTVDGGWTSW